MRKAFVETLVELAAKDDRVVLLTGDLGFMVVEPFVERFPDRFFNAGVAEQNMLGMAAGLAASGHIPFVYSIATFSVLRPYEFIRNDVAMHHLPVRIAGVGGGMEYGQGGFTHHALEDLAVLRPLDGMTILAPADPEQTRSAVRQTWDLPGPVYYRLGKNDKDTIPELAGRFTPGETVRLREGDDALLISTGAVTTEAIAAVESLATEGITCEMHVVASLHPAPVESLLDALSRHGKVLTVEEHHVNGGLGSLVCELVAENGLACRVRRAGAHHLEGGYGGSHAYLRRQNGLDAASLVQTVREMLK